MFSFEQVQRWVYILELLEGKYYIGTTDNIEKRYKKHGKKHGAAWTFLYKPLKILEVIDAGISTETEAIKVENKVTLECMRKYGWKNVRGGVFSSPNDFIIYEKLLLLSKQQELTFIIEKPIIVPESHLQRILKGSNRSKTKINVFDSFDKKNKATIFASISGYHGGKTAAMTVAQLEQFDINNLIMTWYESKKERFPGIKLTDVTTNFEKLHSDKIDRYRKRKVKKR